MTDNIVIKGGRQHNLKNVNLTLPRNKFIVFTGLSGSGKSSLAFDTIYAEGQRRYVESLSSYARQFLGQMDKPEVESIEGMSPSISIDQKTTSKNPRSTVGTVTEIYDYLRLLFARVGHPYCPICGKEITSYTVDQMVDRVMELEERSRVVILAPVVRRRKGTHKKVLDKIKKDGFIRAVVDGEMLDITAEEVELDKNLFHDISIVVDRLIVKEGIESTLSDSMELALKESDGIVNVEVIDGETFVFSSKLACPDCNIVIEEITPRSFSFNSPLGACEVCNGLGFSKEPDPQLIIPNEDLSISEGAIASFSNVDGTYYMEIFKQIAKHYKFSEKAPIKEAPKEMVKDILYGTKYNVIIRYKSMFSGMTGFKGNWEGVLPNLK